MLAAATGAADAAAPAGGARYAGTDSDGLPVHLRVSHGAGYVARMTIRYRVTCDDGAQGSPTTNLFDLRIDRHGRFRFNGTYTGHADGSKNHVHMHGRISRRRASGTFVLDGKRGKVRCRSSHVTWHARVNS